MMTKKSLIQSPEAIEKMRIAGKLASDVLVIKRFRLAKRNADKQAMMNAR